MDFDVKPSPQGGPPIGAMPPPPGVTPNFDDPASNAPGVIAVTSVTMSIAILLVVMRSYTRLLINRILAWDDFFCIFAMIISSVTCGCVIALTHFGLGKHMWDVPVRTVIPNFPKLIMMVAATYQLSIFCLKTSILLLYMRIFSTSKSLRYISWSTIVFIFVFYIVGFFMTILACRPQRKIWDPMVEGTCHRWAAGQVVAAAINIATDVLVLVLPLRQVWKLQLPRKQKWGLSAIFAVGSFACVTTIIRLDLAVHVLRNPNPDFTWEGTKPAVWGAIELNLGICCACAPMLKPFLRHHFPRIFTATRHTPSASAPSTFASKISSPHSVSPASSSSPPFGRRTEDRKFAEGSVVADSDLSSIERGTFLQLQEKGADGDVRYGSGGSYGQR